MRDLRTSPIIFLDRLIPTKKRQSSFIKLDQPMPGGGKALGMLNANGLLPNLETLKDVQILVVDNHRDSRDLDAFLLESYGANVATIGSIRGALDILDSLIPDLLICEIAFPGESVDPLLERVKDLALIAERVIPILVTSTYPATNFAKHLTAKVEAYLLKPLDLDDLVDQVRNLVGLCCKKDAVLA